MKIFLILSSTVFMAACGVGTDGHTNGSHTSHYYSGGSSSGSWGGSSGGTSNGSGNGWGGSSGGTSNGSGDGSWGSSGGTSNGSGNGSGTSNGSGNGSGWSVGSDSTDTDLQLAQIQNQDFENRAEALSGDLQMSVESARSLTRIADQFQVLGASGNGLSLADQDAISASALAVAKIDLNEVKQAITTMVQTGDQKAIQALMNKAATNLGMPNSAGLREKLFPALGIQF